ncbi:hypothetical protein OS493_027616 [Desmophyllum pertusum]|uniref:GOST seven transmembrane domain-containing protein n=1 Tax=Desmophyllum pertusum TaxID=174260 RepID=A0A9W9ZLE1_9CNID|nr:hypothetical protein OS493_027616 [Desmophyllum pertusum]
MATSVSGKTYFVFLVFILLVPFGWGRDHHIQLKDEVRQTIELSKFGFLQNGILRVNFSNMVVKGNGGQSKDVLFGFSLEKTGSDGISPYMEQHSEKCILKDQSQLITNANQISLALITFDLKNGHIIIKTIGSDFLNLTIDKKPALPVHLHAETAIKKLATTSVLPSAGQNTSTTPGSVVPKSSVASASTVSVGPKSSTTSGSPSSTGPNTSTASSLTNAGGDTSATSTSSTAGKNSSTSASPSTKQTSSAVTPTSQAASVPKNNLTTANPEANELPKVQSNSDGNVSAKTARRRRRNANTTPVTLVKSEVKTLPLKIEKTVNISEFKYSGNFVVKVKSKAEEGLYNLYFHNCPLPNKERIPVPVAIQIHIVEKNGANFLSAGEEPLPYMFGVLSVLFFGTAIYWLRVLRKNRDYTYKVHYMMFVLVLLKAMDLMFQAVNYHFISRDGKPAESWEVLYYITHLLKGALLFTTIVLIGTGYFFIKHVLSDRDKKIFLIIIPLQILANTAQIVMESTEEASVQYATWISFNLLLIITVELTSYLLCCGAILFPVVWSIRHLQEGSQTDGKAALNLAKLKLFRHFYVMIVCYIYFTRIIVYLIKITVPFQYMWLDDFFNNAASYVFFVLTGYKFRPAPDNPYLHVPQGDSDDEVEMEEVVTNAGIANGVTRLQTSSSGKRIFETA